MSMIESILTWPEVLLAANVGVLQQWENLQKGRQDTYGLDPAEGGWNEHINGACGEMATAKHYGVYWSGNIGNLRADDVRSVQVRTTQHMHGHLLLHHPDHDDRAYIHVTGTAPRYLLHGWILGKLGKNSEYWGELPRHPGRPCFIVPKDALRPMGELRLIDAGAKPQGRPLAAPIHPSATQHPILPNRPLVDLPGASSQSNPCDPRNQSLGPSLSYPPRPRPW